MSDRDELIQAAVRAYKSDQTMDANSPGLEWLRVPLARAVDAVEALARADEREKIARQWQWNDWTLLTPHVKKGSVIGAAQAVTDWLRSKDE